MFYIFSNLLTIPGNVTLVEHDNFQVITLLGDVVIGKGIVSKFIYTRDPAVVSILMTFDDDVIYGRSEFLVTNLKVPLSSHPFYDGTSYCRELRTNTSLTNFT